MKAIALVAIALIPAVGVAGPFEDQVAVKLKGDFEFMVKHYATMTELCAQAGVVKAGYLNARNDAKYTNWKNEEALICGQAARADGGMGDLSWVQFVKSELVAEQCPIPIRQTAKLADCIADKSQHWKPTKEQVVAETKVLFQFVWE